MTIKLEVTENTASPALRRAIAQMRGPGRDLMLNHMGEYLVRSTRDRAAREISPDGKAWQKLSPAYKRRKDKKRPGVPILKFDFHMLGDRFVHQVDDEGLVVGTGAPYGAIQQEGGTVHIPAHPRTLAFRRNKRSGRLRFAKGKQVNHTQDTTIPAHDVRIPSRRWLGVSTEDDTELLDIASDHLAGMFDAD